MIIRQKLDQFSFLLIKGFNNCEICDLIQSTIIKLDEFTFNGAKRFSRNKTAIFLEIINKLYFIILVSNIKILTKTFCSSEMINSSWDTATPKKFLPGFHIFPYPVPLESLSPFLSMMTMDDDNRC